MTLNYFLKVLIDEIRYIVIILFLLNGVLILRIKIFELTDLFRAELLQNFGKQFLDVYILQTYSWFRACRIFRRRCFESGRRLDK